MVGQRFWVAGVEASRFRAPGTPSAAGPVALWWRRLPYDHACDFQACIDLGIPWSDIGPAWASKRYPSFESFQRQVHSVCGKSPEKIERTLLRELALQILRNNQLEVIRLVPQPAATKDIFGRPVQSYKIGIATSGTEDSFIVKRYGPAGALWKGMQDTWKWSSR